MEKSLEYIIKKIEEYNKEHPDKSVQLVPKYIDVQNAFVCLYDHGQVGLFERINFHTPIGDNHQDHCFQAGSIYKGITSEDIGILTTHQGWFSLSHWEEAGFEVFFSRTHYIATCDMKESISYEDMRRRMYQDTKEEKIPFLGRATTEEIAEVLNYAKNYYDQKTYIKKRKEM